MIEIAIAGAGPAGAYCALSLAREGFHPVLFDHSHPREKPCGGALSPFTQDEFPFLKTLPFIHEEANYVQIVYMHDRKIGITLKRKFIITSRQRLDNHILDMAISNGARLEKEKIIGVKRSHDYWKVRTNKKLYTAKILIGADGVLSVVRNATIGPFQPHDVGMCYGYLAKPMRGQCTVFRFLPARRGYIWVFPRGDDVCVGIGADMNRGLGLKNELDRFLKSNCPQLELKSEWAALLPNLHSYTLRKPTAGSNWILIGDAAGHVDPITGEGIPYALRSAELACKAVLQNNLKLYDFFWREEYGTFLSYSAELKGMIFNRCLCTPYFMMGLLMSGKLAR